MQHYPKAALAVLALIVLSALVIARPVPLCASAEDAAAQPQSAVGEPAGELDKGIFHIFQARNGDYWFGSWTEGLYRYTGGGLTHFTTRDGLSSNHITEIKEDQAGNVFFGTGAGVDRFDGQRFEPLQFAADNDPHDWRLEPGDLWFKSGEGKQGPYRYDGQELHYLEFPQQFMDDQGWKNDPQPWGPYDIYQIYQDRSGHMWFGTAVFGVCRFDGERVSWLYERHLTVASNGGEFGIRALFEDAQGMMWINSTRYLYDAAPEVLTGGVSDMVDYSRMPGPGIKGVRPEHRDTADGGECLGFMSIVEDAQHDLWMACYGAGVYRYDGEKLIHYPLLYEGKPITTFSVYLDKVGGLWVGTHEHGAYKFNGRTFEQFRPAV